MKLDRLAWYARRLRAMSAAEVVHRARRSARYPFDRARMQLGLYAPVPPELADWRGPKHFYFDDVSRPLDPVVRDYAERILDGKRHVLGLGWIAVPRDCWHLEPSRGVEWPRLDAARVLRAVEGLDARMTWELNRGHEWVTLARASATDARFRTELFAQLASWREHNPLGVGINWASPMEAAIRIHSLAWVAAFLRGEPLGEISAMIHTHAVFVRRHLSRHSSANNHLLVELSALAVAERVLCARADEAAVEEFARELERQTFADGVNREMATHYHEFVLEAARLVTELERMCGAARVEIEAIVARMQGYIDVLAGLHQGDNDDGKIVALLQLEPKWLSAAVAQPWSMRDSGQVVLRSDRITASFDAGPFGFGSLAAHAHCDCLALNVAVDGDPLFVERGTYRYNGDRAARDRYRMTGAHNTLQIGEREQAEPGGPFLWRTQPRVTLEHVSTASATASHDGFGTLHRRCVELAGDELRVVDEADATFVVRWHLAPGRVARVDGRQVDVGDAVLAVDGGEIALRETQHSAIYGACETATTIEIKAQHRLTSTLRARRT